MKVNENLTMAERAKAAIVAKIVWAGLVPEGEAHRITLADVPYYMDWATGFGGIWFVGETEAGEEFFFTPGQWNALENNAREQLCRRTVGMLFRAKGREFVIALQDCPDTYAWSPADAKVDLTWIGGTFGAALDFDGPGNTDKLLAVESAAAGAAVNYKNTGIHGAMLADWYLPACGQWWLIFAYRNKINAALKAFFGTANNLAQATFWSSTPFDNSRACALPNPAASIFTSNIGNPYRTEQCKVRTCSQYKCTKRYMIYGKD